MLLLLMPAVCSRFLRCLLVLILVGLSVYPSSSFALTVHHYSPSQQWGFDEYALYIGGITTAALPQTGTHDYEVYFRYERPDGTTGQTTGKPFKVVNGVVTSGLPMVVFGPGNSNTLQLGTYANLRVFIIGKLGGGAVPDPSQCSISGDKTLTVTMIDGPGRTAASVKTLASGVFVSTSAVLHLGPAPCPPRDLTFELDLAIQAAAGKPHSVLVSLQINALPPLELVGPQVMVGPVQMDLAPVIPNVPGQFTYVWRLNGVPIAQGTYGCGDEIPNNKVSDFATTPALELEDSDGDGDPDNTDPDIDGDGVPNENEGDPIVNTPPPGTNAGPGAPSGSAGTPIQQPGTALPQPNPTGGGGGGGGTTGDVNVLNVKDFGNAFKWALEEAGNANGYFPAPGNGADPTAGLGALEQYDPGEISKAPLEEWEQEWDNALAEAGNLRNASGDLVTAMASHKPVKPIAPAPNGVWRFEVGAYFATLFNQSFFDIDVRPYNGAIQIFRQCFAWLLGIIAWFKFWNYFRSMISI